MEARAGRGGKVSFAAPRNSMVRAPGPECSEFSANAARLPVNAARLQRVFHQRRGPVYRVDEFSIRHREKQGEDDSQMHSQQRSHSRRLPQREQEKARGGDEKKQRQKRNLPHSLQPRQSERASHHRNASAGPKDHGYAEISIRRFPAQRVMIESRRRRGREAQAESIERKVVEPPARLRLLLDRIRTPSPAAIQIAQRQHVLQSLKQRAGV